MGSRANERASVAVATVGKPPPPIAPTGIEPAGAEPEPYRNNFGLNIIGLLVHPRGTNALNCLGMTLEM